MLSEKLKSEWAVLEGENKKYVYGEVSLLALSDVLHRFCPQGGVFYDLGSGSGRAVFSAAINHPTFTKLVGVELLEGLHTIADRALGAYNAVRVVVIVLPPLVGVQGGCSGSRMPAARWSRCVQWGEWHTRLAELLHEVIHPSPFRAANIRVHQDKRGATRKRL